MTDRRAPKAVLLTRSHCVTDGDLPDAQSITGLVIDGCRLECAGGSDLVLSGGPGPTTLTVTLIVSSVEFEDEAVYADTPPLEPVDLTPTIKALPRLVPRGALDWRDRAWAETRRFIDPDAGLKE